MSDDMGKHETDLGRPTGYSRKPKRPQAVRNRGGFLGSFIRKRETPSRRIYNRPQAIPKTPDQEIDINQAIRTPLSRRTLLKIGGITAAGLAALGLGIWRLSGKDQTTPSSSPPEAESTPAPDKLKELKFPSSPFAKFVYRNYLPRDNEYPLESDDEQIRQSKLEKIVGKAQKLALTRQKGAKAIHDHYFPPDKTPQLLQDATETLGINNQLDEATMTLIEQQRVARAKAWEPKIKEILVEMGVTEERLENLTKFMVILANVEGDGDERAGEKRLIKFVAK